jgi:hypothetical protein
MFFHLLQNDFALTHTLSSSSAHGVPAVQVDTLMRIDSQGNWVVYLMQGNTEGREQLTKPSYRGFACSAGAVMKKGSLLQK